VCRKWVLRPASSASSTFTPEQIKVDDHDHDHQSHNLQQAISMAFLRKKTMTQQNDHQNFALKAQQGNNYHETYPRRTPGSRKFTLRLHDILPARRRGVVHPTANSQPCKNHDDNSPSGLPPISGPGQKGVRMWITNETISLLLPAFRRWKQGRTIQKRIRDNK
jgi:hypothetical protein